MKEKERVLPKSWDDVCYKDYQKILNIAASDISNIDKTIETISILTGISVDDLNSITPLQLHAIQKQLSFFQEQPQPKKSNKISIKKIDNLTWNEYVDYTQSVTNNNKDLLFYIECFSKVKREVLESLSVSEVFFLKNQLGLNMKRFMYRSVVFLIRMTIRLTWKKMVNRT